jgi:mono/diheme cytochrome c family protein
MPPMQSPSRKGPMLKSRMSHARAGALVLAAILLPLASSAQEGPQGWWWNMWKGDKSTPWELKNMSPEQRQRLVRHSVFMNKEVSKDYLDATNDVGYTTKAILAGGDLYAANCAKCHGDTGLGNGEMAGDLAPSPALLAYLMDQPIAVDPYLLWSISEGGFQFGTKMPAFKDVLTKQQIWQIVAYLRAGFPEVGSVAGGTESSQPKSGTPSEDEAGPAAGTSESAAPPQAKPDE